MALKCPRCDGEMAPRLVGEVEYDHCGNCRGLWFDAFEHEALKASPEAAGVDTGPPSTRSGGSKQRLVHLVPTPADAVDVDDAIRRLWIGAESKGVHAAGQPPAGPVYRLRQRGDSSPAADEYMVELPERMQPVLGHR